jgi:hypothetical protein
MPKLRRGRLPKSRGVSPSLARICPNQEEESVQI